MTVPAARMAAQRLSRPAEDLASLLADVVALQAQDVPALRLAARARGVRELTGPVVRTWAMRGTLHLLAVEDLWVVALLGPVFRAAGRRRRAQLGLADELCARALPALREVLTGPLDRAAVVARLAEVGVVVDASTQAPAHLMAYAAFSGVLSRGLDDTYALLPDLPEPRGVDELWRRYRRAYGPATPDDFVAWSGLPKRTARDLPDLAAEDFPPDGTVRMLGHFDPFLLGYRDRSALLDPAFAKRVQTGGGFLTPHVLVDGRVVATWRRDGRVFRVEPFGARPDVSGEVSDLGVFLGLDADLTWV
ncbi:crosslink repair DNA glycosylase YcaQ family protein [Actinosynnema sp. NPDC020468]|uniref:DNA glycosylase AlkZ-like family protein n=1 Tax=Actinosynnema sp. NPDC020468 TaxID=3154488 RepID=UPI0033E93E92